MRAFSQSRAACIVKIIHIDSGHVVGGLLGAEQGEYWTLNHFTLFRLALCLHMIEQLLEQCIIIVILSYLRLKENGLDI